MDIRKGMKFTTKKGKRGKVLQVRGDQVRVRTGDNEYWTSSKRLAQFAIFEPGKILVHTSPSRTKSGLDISEKRYLREDTGELGLTTDEDRKWYHPKGTLHGWRSNQSPEVRRAHLVDTVNNDGAQKTLQRLVALRNVTTVKQVERVTTDDIKWIQRRYFKGKRR